MTVLKGYLGQAFSEETVFAVPSPTVVGENVSSFATNVDEKSNVIIEPHDAPKDLFETRKKSFQILLKSRLGYLRSLENLGTGWTSGAALQPDRTSLGYGKQLLECFYLCLEKIDEMALGTIDEKQNNSILNKAEETEFSFPSIVIGPMPVGGISVEFHAGREKKLYVSIYNGGNIEVDVENNGYFFSLENFPFNPRRLLEKYEALIKI